MSKYLTFKQATFKNKALLLEALKKCGFGPEKVEQGTGLHLFGYGGDQRAETADIVIRRKFVGNASNDVGFKKNTDGSYTPLVSEYDTRTFQGGKFLTNVQVHYAEGMAYELAHRLGSQMPVMTQQGPTMKLVVRL